MIRLPRAHVTRLEELSERLTGVEFPFEAPSNPSLRELLAAHTRYLDFHDKFADKRFRYELSHVQPPDFLDFSEETNWKVLILSPSMGGVQKVCDCGRTSGRHSYDGQPARSSLCCAGKQTATQGQVLPFSGVIRAHRLQDNVAPPGPTAGRVRLTGPPVARRHHLDLTLEHHRDMLRRGSVLVDERDPGHG